MNKNKLGQLEIWLESRSLIYFTTIIKVIRVFGIFALLETNCSATAPE